MNKKLLEMNKEALNDKEKAAVKRQLIVADIRKKGYSTDDQLALLFNVIVENLDNLKPSKHKDELIAFLEERDATKKENRE